MSSYRMWPLCGDIIWLTALSTIVPFLTLLTGKNDTMETRNPKRLRALEKEVIQPVYLSFPVAPYPVNRTEFHLLRTRRYFR
jgi:hypothetical protein